ncbi:MAG: DUF4345 family protein [Sphingomonadaceae bacterium]|nr:DUF4345 family protein [Sphingomonadaceae bacterium]
MMNLALRILVGLWGLGFGLLAVQGILDPRVFTTQFGINAPGASINSVRGDFGAFFLVSAVCALWAAWKPEKEQLLYVPAALYGTALTGRLIGLGLGDPASGANHQAMIIEGASVLLMLFSARRLGTG